MDPITMLAALLPAGIDVVKALTRRFITPDFTPKSIEEYVKVNEVDVARFKALADAGGASITTYPWVDAIVKLMRPGAALIVLATWAAVRLGGLELAEHDAMTLNNTVGAVLFYLFGDRSLYYAKRGELKG